MSAHPLPSGTRDVLPEEMRELRAVAEAVRGAAERAGYGEVYTPALEFESTLARAGVGDARPAYRLFDEKGDVLVLRSDMTVPIARLVATRYGDARPPLRFSYVGHTYRGVRPQRGQPRELLQAGVELVGAPGAEGDVEALEVLCAALDATGLRDYRIGIGDARLFPGLLEPLDLAPTRRTQILHELVTRDFVGLERELGGVRGGELLVAVPQRRGGPEVLEWLAGEGVELGELGELHDRLAPAIADRVIYDLGLVRRLGYYTGVIFEVYHPGLGAPLGGGGRYDDLLGRFGRSLPAVGWALGVERMHIAITEQGA